MSDGCYDLSGSNLIVPVFAYSAVRIIFDGVLGNLRAVEPTCNQIGAEGRSPREITLNKQHNALGEAITGLSEIRPNTDTK